MTSRRTSTGLLIGLTLATLLGLACLGLACLPFEWLRARLDAFSGDGSADRFSPALHLKLRLGMLACGVIVLAVVIAGGIFRRRLTPLLRSLGTQLGSQAGALVRDAWSRSRQDGAALLVVTLLALAVRLPYWNQPLRYDETHSFLNYVDQPLFVTIAKYDDANNHVFHNVLEHFATRILGDAPRMMRLPALIAGVLLVPILFLGARMTAWPHAAWPAALLCVTSSPLIEFSTNARGYTLVALLTLLTGMAAARFRRTGELVSGLAMMVLGALGLWTVPTMLFALILIWTPLLWSAHERSPSSPHRQKTWGLIAGTLLVAALLYLPIVLASSPLAALEDSTGPRVAMAQRLSALLASLTEAGRLLLRDVPIQECWVLAFFALIALAGPVPRRCLLGWGLSLLLVLLSGKFPPARVWLFLIPLSALLVGMGIARLLDRLLKTGIRAPVALQVAVVLALFPWAHMVSHKSIARSEETGSLPESREMVEELRGYLNAGDHLVAVAPASALLVYWSRKLHVRESVFDPVDDVGDVYVVISSSAKQSLNDIFGQLGLQHLPQNKFRHFATYSHAQVLVWKRPKNQK